MHCTARYNKNIRIASANIYTLSLTNPGQEKYENKFIFYKFYEIFTIFPSPVSKPVF
jgi:hypothetical protein